MYMKQLHENFMQYINENPQQNTDREELANLDINSKELEEFQDLVDDLIQDKPPTEGDTTIFQIQALSARNSLAVAPEIKIHVKRDGSSLETL